MTAVEVEENFVTVSWVAKHYGVSKLRVYRAINRRLLTAARVTGHPSVLVLDRRELPLTFPR